MGSRFFYLITLANGLIWLRSSFEKISGGKFVESLGGTLEKFASKNPYLFIQNFLHNVAIPNSIIFGYLVMIGEAFAAISIAVSSLYLISTKQKNKFILAILGLGLLVGVLLNGVFWFASGWISPSTDSLNLLMFAIQLIILIYLLSFLKNA